MSPNFSTDGVWIWNRWTDSKQSVDWQTFYWRSKAIGCLGFGVQMHLRQQNPKLVSLPWQLLSHLLVVDFRDQSIAKSTLEWIIIRAPVVQIKNTPLGQKKKEKRIKQTKWVILKAHISKACSYVRTCQRVKDSQKITTMCDLLMYICINSTIVDFII